jgi:hypothetical protein
MVKKIETHVCANHTELFALVGGVQGAMLVIGTDEMKVVTLTNGNEGHVYRNDRGRMCVDEIVEAN